MLTVSRAARVKDRPRARNAEREDKLEGQDSRKASGRSIPETRPTEIECPPLNQFSPSLKPELQLGLDQVCPSSDFEPTEEIRPK